ncbi:MAG: acyl-CoA dehydrogenase family protein [Hyphomicrobiales bacterium]|nr:acyl-CoA dehydrogenase family protein [Hyphomicrobiales bacterium]
MNLGYSDEQRLLSESANNLLAARAQKKDARDLWAEMAELGWLAMPLPESHDGLGQGAVDVAILTEAFGRHLASTDYAPRIVLCGGLVAAIGSDAQKAALLPALATGMAKPALAHAEENARHDRAHVATQAARTAGGWRLSGDKIGVLGAAPDRFIVSARIAGSLRDRSGIGLFLVPADARGLRVLSHATVDGGQASRIELKDVELPADALLGANENAFEALDRAVDQAIAAWCAECVGLMEAATAATVDYTKIRIQFGKPLAVNQALRHRIADMSIQCEEGRSMALRAALYADSADAGARARAISGAWAKIAKSARFVAEQAIQLHGGMGVTNELDIGMYLKRVVALEAIVGGADRHLRRHAALSAAARAA